MNKTFLAGAAAIPLVARVAAGCGGGGGGASASAKTPTTANGAPATVGVASTGLGKTLVDARGRTLYLFKKDSGTTSACSGAWPPLPANGKPSRRERRTCLAARTTGRSDGAAQVTYNGHPLYSFVMDKKPSDTNGQGITAFGAASFALCAAGNQVSGSASKSSGGTSSTSGSGGGGYGY